eukprot:scaffold493385_cov18-Prasinocladus_malaysianus.AAC.1
MSDGDKQGRAFQNKLCWQIEFAQFELTGDEYTSWTYMVGNKHGGLTAMAKNDRLPGDSDELCRFTDMGFAHSEIILV